MIRSTDRSIRMFEPLLAIDLKGSFNFMFYGGGFDPDPSLSYGPELMCEDPKKRSSNAAGYCVKEVEALVKKAGVELDDEKRRAIF